MRHHINYNSGSLGLLLRPGLHWLVFIGFWVVLALIVRLLWVIGSIVVGYAFVSQSTPTPTSSPTAATSVSLHQYDGQAPHTDTHTTSIALNQLLDQPDHTPTALASSTSTALPPPLLSQPTTPPVSIPSEPTFTPVSDTRAVFALNEPADAPPTLQPSVHVPPPVAAPPATTIPAAPAGQPEVVEPIVGTVHWTTANSPLVLGTSIRLMPGSTLIIDPGVEVRIQPGVSIYVGNEFGGAQLMAVGKPGYPVHIIGGGLRRWNGIYGDPGSLILLEHTRISGGGANGTLLYSKEGQLAIRYSHIVDNGGVTLAVDSEVEVSNTEIAANDVPFEAVLNLQYNRGNRVTLIGNRIGGNRLPNDASGVQITNFSPLQGVDIHMAGNLIRGGQYGNLLVSTAGPIYGTIACNAFVGDELGVSIRTQTLQVPPPELAIIDNLIDGHTPPIEPIYLDSGIGRGAASEVALDMRNNWWGERSGPYHPEENPEGRGDSVGNNIFYEPWHETAPLCVPPQ